MSKSILKPDKITRTRNIWPTGSNKNSKNFTSIKHFGISNEKWIEQSTRGEILPMHKNTDCRPPSQQRLHFCLTFKSRFAYFQRGGPLQFRCPWVVLSMLQSLLKMSALEQYCWCLSMSCLPILMVLLRYVLKMGPTLDQLVDKSSFFVIVLFICWLIFYIYSELSV